MIRNTFYWQAARYIAVAFIPGADARYFTYASKEDAMRDQAGMREFHGDQGRITFYTIQEAGDILRDAAHWTMCRDCERCRPSRPHLRQPGKRYECGLLGTDGHWYVDPEKDGCTWGTKRTIPLCASCQHRENCEHEAVKPILCADYRKEAEQ